MLLQVYRYHRMVSELASTVNAHLPLEVGEVAHDIRWMACAYDGCPQGMRLGTWGIDMRQGAFELPGVAFDHH